MSTTLFTILYVSNVRTSAQFYTDRLGVPVAEESPGFAMLPLPGGAMLGLWIKTGVSPAPTAAPGASELAFTIADARALQAMHDEWVSKGVPMLNGPVMMDFGLNFTAVDPDGHRLRMFVPAM
jgi:catechol 2,3-dioxygenase-like lactoylglutathione lyase family enzyme